MVHASVFVQLIDAQRNPAYYTVFVATDNLDSNYLSELEASWNGQLDDSVRFEVVSSLLALQSAQVGDPHTKEAMQERENLVQSIQQFLNTKKVAVAMAE